MKIGQLAESCGVATSAIRFYEAKGLLQKPLRESGRRIYRDGSVYRLKLVLLLQRLGFRIREIKMLMSAFNGREKPRSWNKMAQTKIEELEVQIEESKKMVELLKKGLRCSCLDVKTCVEKFEERRD